MQSGHDTAEETAAAPIAEPPAGNPAWRARPHLTLGRRVGQTLSGFILARPWFDKIALAALNQVYFPASRLWVAAREAEGDMDRFYAGVPMTPRLDRRAQVAAALAEVTKADAALSAMNAEWERVFFGGEETSDERRVAVEEARLSLAHALNSTRWSLVRAAGRNFQKIKLALTSPADVQAAFGETRQSFAAREVYPAQMPEVEMSRSLPTQTSIDYWLRFKSPAAGLGDTVTARVHEPRGAVHPPTIVFGHGVCVEFDHWDGLIDESEALVARGFRVVRPEAPWHGRRTPPGRFGGEHAIATFPLGILQAFSGAVTEWAVLADWARRTSTGPLVFAGSSLGAMTAQMAAEASNDWPETVRPDALFLVTHTGNLPAVIMKGAISELWIAHAELARHGWSDEHAAEVVGWLDPARPMPMPASRIVSILAQRDNVLPYKSGRDLVERWSVPTRNVFEYDCGHFSVPTRLMHDPSPLDRLSEIVAGIGATPRAQE